MIILVFYLQWRQDSGTVQIEAMSGAESFLKVLALALLQEYKSSMRDGYPYRAPDYSFNFTHREKEA